jgi:uncharacterized protein (DUF2236 family)
VILVPKTGIRGPKGLAELTGFVTTGLLPDAVRRHYQIPWSRAHSLAHRGLSFGLRSSKPLFPRELRVSPVYEFAVARAAGELLRTPSLTEVLVAKQRVA